MEKILLKDFVDGYKNCSSDDQRNRYIRTTLKTVPYVSYAMKDVIARNIIRFSTHEILENGEIGSKIFINSGAKNMLFKLSLVQHWTNIEIDFTDVVKAYDMLAEQGLFEIIIKKIPEIEAAEFASMVDWTMRDFMDNEFNAQAYVTSQVRRFGELAGTALTPLLENMANEIKNMDEKKVEKVLNKVNNFSKMFSLVDSKK